jgi:hypothetical protein
VLRPRERLFIEAYLATRGNGTESARRAGYTGSANVLAATASRLLRSVKVQEAIRERTEKAVERVHGTATPERVLQVLGEQLEAGRVPAFRVDPETGEPIVDLRAMEAAGTLHLVKKVTETPGVELYSSQEAAAILGRFFGMEKRRPEEEHSPLVDARAFVVAVLESGDPKAMAALKAIALKMYPGPPDVNPHSRG